MRRGIVLLVVALMVGAPAGVLVCMRVQTTDRLSGVEPEVGGSGDLGECANCLVRPGFHFSAFRVVVHPMAPSCAMDVPWRQV